MMILSIDSAGGGCGVCVSRNGATLAKAYAPMERGQDQRLLPLINDVLAEAKTSFSAIDRIAVTRGPGSFTGVRIGLAAARGIGLALRKPVVGIDRFSIYHHPLRHAGKPVLVVIDSRRRELYCRYYPASGAAHEPAMMTRDDIAVFLKEHPGTHVIGDAALQDNAPRPPADETLTATQLAAAADPAAPDFMPRPLYIRAPDVTLPRGESGIQAVTVHDAPPLAEIHAACFAASWSAEQIASSLALPTTHGWAAVQGNAMIGFILCQMGEEACEILTFCALPEHRRKGMGEKLLTQAIEAARAAGAKSLFLDVAADNAAAIGLYKKHGFAQTGKRANYYRQGTAFVDALLFTLSL